MKNLFIFLFFGINLAFAFNVECDKKQYCSGKWIVAKRQKHIYNNAQINLT